MTTLIKASSHNLSTITAAQIWPVAFNAIKRFTKRSDTASLERYFGSHVSLEDLAMDAVEKVVRANPIYLTKSYVNMAAKCVCIDALQKGKITQIEIQAITTYDVGDSGPIEDSIEFDAYDHTEDLETFLLTTFSPQETLVYEGLKSRKMYVELAEDLRLSLRTFERQVRDLKWKIQYLLLEEEPES